MLTADWLCYVFFLAKIQNMHTTHKQTNKQTDIPIHHKNWMEKNVFFSRKSFLCLDFFHWENRKKIFSSSCFTRSHFIIHQKEKKICLFKREKLGSFSLFFPKRRFIQTFYIELKILLGKTFVLFQFYVQTSCKIINIFFFFLGFWKETVLSGASSAETLPRKTREKNPRKKMKIILHLDVVAVVKKRKKNMRNPFATFFLHERKMKKVKRVEQ